MARLRDVDSANRMQVLRISGLAISVGLVMSIPVGVMIQSRWDWPEWLAYLVPFMTIAGFIFGVSSAITWNAGRAAGTIHNPSGKGTPYRQEYSRAAALVIRGNYDEAVEAYREHIAEQPEDPEPYLRLARLLRDQLDRYDDAAHWFKAARQSARITARQEVFITRELIELATDKLRDPARAAPELARLIERFPGAPEAVWARAELREIKKQIGEA